MRRIRFSLNPQTPPTAPDGSPGVSYGVLDGNMVHETPNLFINSRGRSHPVEDVRLLPPCWPSKIVCVGRNYAEHAREFNNEVPAEPLIFLKPPSSLLAKDDDIVYPPLSQRVDFEGELGIVIGRRARNVRRTDAWEHVFGFTIVNDVTARDLQKKDGQWTRGKGFDTFCPVGPVVVPLGEVEFETLRVRAYLDGDLKQDAPVTDMLFPVDAIIEYVTQFMTLEPGDLIATGTPPGVGPMTPGSVVRIDIEGIGALENRVTHPSTQEEQP